MNKQKTHTAKYSFYYLLSLVTLFIVSISVGTIIFEIINYFFPEIVYHTSSAINGAFSGVLIATPIFYFITSKIYKGLKDKEIEKDSEIRKWFTYLILFVSSVVIIAVLIRTLNSFLEGGATINLILKTLTVFVIAAIISSFYFFDIKNNSKKLVKTYTIISFIIILLVFISSFFIMESPTEARNRKIDESTLDNFQFTRQSIDEFYRINESLPENLEALKEQSFYGKPVYMSDQVMDYEIISENKYKLCAEFKTSNIEKTVSYYDELWEHNIGYQCKEIIINKK